MSVEEALRPRARRLPKLLVWLAGVVVLATHFLRSALVPSLVPITALASRLAIWITCLLLQKTT